MPNQPNPHTRALPPPPKKKNTKYGFILSHIIPWDWYILTYIYIVDFLWVFMDR